MYQFFVEPQQIDLECRRVVIRGKDVNHIKNVLRMKPGEEISVSDGRDQKEYRCGILELSEDRVLCELRFVKQEGVELPVKVFLFQGLPKGDKMELIVQKAVELGVHEIIPVGSGRCVVRLDEKKAGARVLRWQKIAEAAAKQSRRGIIPRVGEVISFRQAVRLASSMDLKIIPYELAEGMERTRELLEGLMPGQSVAVFIGPEGGFEEKEVQLASENGITPITLGRRILRTETAGIAVMSWITYLCE